MGTGASKTRPGGTAARFVAEEARNASTVELRNAFAVLSDSERERVLEAFQTVNVSKVAPPQAAVPSAPGDMSSNPLGLDFSCFGTASSPIPDTERRGMQLQQLLAIIAFIEKHADERGVLPRWVDWNGAANHTDSLNLYDLVKYVVNPATAPYKCSFVELVAPPGTTAQTPRWFVSHWWGEPVKDFIKAVEYHARQRFAPRGEFKCEGGTYWEKPEHEIVGEPADADATYWVCA